MTSLNTKYLFLALSLAALVLIGALVYGTYRINSFSQKTSAMLQLADESAQAEILTQSLRVLQKDAAEDLEALEASTLSEADLVPFVESIEAVGRGLGLETNIVSLVKTEDKKGVEPTMIKITVEALGSWTNSATFLRAIEKMPYRLIIDETSLDKEDLGWRLKVVLSTHLFKVQ